MAPRRRFLARPHDHLARAADVHARIIDGESAEQQDGEEQAPQGAESTKAGRTRDQRRTQRGRFA